MLYQPSYPRLVINLFFWQSLKAVQFFSFFFFNPENILDSAMLSAEFFQTMSQVVLPSKAKISVFPFGRL